MVVRPMVFRTINFKITKSQLLIQTKHSVKLFIQIKYS